VFHPGPDGGENGAYLSAPLGYGDPFIVPLSPTSQGQHHPLLCIKCWKKHKQDKYQQQDHAPLSPSTFSNLRPDKQALRLGVVVNEGVSTRTVHRHITNREELLARYADGSTLASLHDNSPRPYPTIRPMDKEARATHSRYGRVFETSMLCFTLNHCHCCGITQPFHDDPQQNRLAASKDHTFRRVHLVKRFYEAWYCTCIAICRGGQYYGTRKTKEIEWFTDKHGFEPCEERLGDDSKKSICDSCYADLGDGGTSTIQYLHLVQFHLFLICILILFIHSFFVYLTLSPQPITCMLLFSSEWFRFHSSAYVQRPRL
jgi:hypothetical protein